MTGGGVLLYLALNYTTAINVSLVNSTQPALTVLCARLIVGDKIKPFSIFGDCGCHDRRHYHGQ